MINYYTQVNVNETFNQEILLEMFFMWMETSKRNKMKTVKYQNEASYTCEEGKKKLCIKDFKHNKVFGIQFTTKDNNKHARFVVEIMYDYGNQTMGLSFYKEMLEDSIYFPSIDIPKIFTQLLQSSYVEKDGELAIVNEPYTYTQEQLEALLNTESELPLVVLKDAKNKLIKEPNKLAERLFGLAHVICVDTKKESSLQIYYPNQDVETIEDYPNSQLLNICYNLCLDASIEEHSQNYTFNELVKVQLQQEKATSEELEEYYKSEQKQLEEEVAELKGKYQQINEEYLALLEENEKLASQTAYLNKQILLTAKENVEEKREKIKKIIEICAKNHQPDGKDKNERYRKTDIINSIMEDM